MHDDLFPVMKFLSEVEKAQGEGWYNVCDILSINPASTIGNILDGKGKEICHEDLANLLGDVAKIIGTHRIQSNITHWPFENFWANPSEPYHSKLLRYFINPDEKHCCDSFLRATFLKALAASLNLPVSTFPDDSCVIAAETRDESGQIDILITRTPLDGDSPKFAIIIENKINRAPNQKHQLQRYVKRAKSLGFNDEEIFVFFLPLIDDCNPDYADKKSLPEKVIYNKITYELHIRPWLDQVLHEWPDHLDERIHEHLSYYRNLISHLINKRKTQEMDSIIIREHLNKAAQTGNLPTWSQIAQVVESVGTLQRCFERMQRGRMLCEVQASLEKHGKTYLFVQKGAIVEQLGGVCQYEELSQTTVGVCMPINAGVGVCFGMEEGSKPEDTFWIGYLRIGETDDQVWTESDDKEAMRRLRLSSDDHDNKPYYRWNYRSGFNFDNCLANAGKIADELLEMRACFLGKQ
jgi:hypothetical protein